MDASTDHPPGQRRRVRPSLICGSLLIAMLQWRYSWEATLYAVAVIVMCEMLWAKPSRGSTNLVVLLSPVVLLGLFSAGVMYTGPFGVRDLWLVITVAVTVDIASYVVGEHFQSLEEQGRWTTRQFSQVSSGKTWEGAAGGLVSGLLVGTVVAAICRLPVSDAALLISTSIVAAMAGDLLSSATKRLHGIKDWSTLLGGHGGLLDRVISILVACLMGLTVESVPLWAGVCVYLGLVLVLACLVLVPAPVLPAVKPPKGNTGGPDAKFATESE